MTPDACRSRLTALLERETAGAGRLRELLAREQAALLANDVHALEQVVAEKQGCVVELEAGARERAALLRTAGLPADANGMESCIQSCAACGAGDAAGAGDLAALWRSTSALLRDCREMNQRNGGVIETNRRHAARALAILRGQSGNPGLYGPAGEARADSRSQSLAKA